MRSKNISVCMATYNGSKYIELQMNSILNQLIDGDEVIVIDDASTDSTIELLKKINDSRIKIIPNNSNIGVNKSFEKAISLSNNDYIFMADQDDIWPENRIDIMIQALYNENVKLVSGNSSFIDMTGANIEYPIGQLKKRDSHKVIKNILSIFIGRGYYYGCAMAFKKELVDYILPFPDYIESHDLWIAMCGILLKKSYHIENVVLYRRVHGNNASIINRPLHKKIWSRLVFIISTINLLFIKFKRAI